MQAGWLGNKADDSKILVRRPVQGARRTPDADRDTNEMLGCPHLARDFLASILGKVQVQDDQIWSGSLAVDAQSANKGDGLAPVHQVNQLKSEILLPKRSIKKEDI